MASVVARLLPLNAAERETLALYLRPVLHNWNGFGPTGSPKQSKVASTCNFSFQNDKVIVLRCRPLGSSLQHGSASMTTVQDGPAKPVNESEPLISGPESPRRLVVVAFGWLLLAEAVPVAVRRFATGFVPGLTKGASQLEIPPTLSHLLFTVGAFSAGIVLLYAASIRGRIVGGGDRRLGLGVAPIARLPIIIGLSTVVVLYPALIDFAVYEYRPDLFFQSSSVPLWLILFDSLLIIVIAPLAEELFFRGWLWTGLRKHGGVLPTGLLTAIMWLLRHLLRGVGYVALLLFPALILTIARQVGKSVRATILIHAIFNLTGNFPLIVLFLKLFQN